MKVHMLVADSAGSIHIDPDLLMLMNRCGQWTLPERGDMILLPEESELFFLPGREAVGFNPESGEAMAVDGMAIAAFAAPGYTLVAHPCYLQKPDAPLLPLFAYGAVGFADGEYWIAAVKVDDEPRQQFTHIKPGCIEKESAHLFNRYPGNRLLRHIINNCVKRYGCPAARNFALGRYEAPLPSSKACNARCIGCISQQDEASPIQTTPQCRMAFTPKPEEIVQIMQIHEKREKRTPIYSFGQGCEGDPLVNVDLLCESIKGFRSRNGHGTINCNCNGSKPRAITELAKAGLTSIRISMNSSQPELYQTYHRPVDYSFGDVKTSLAIARESGVFTSLNLLYFPGITDTWTEVSSLAALCREAGVGMIQLRNLNIDPGWYPGQLGIRSNCTSFEPAIGLKRFMKEMKKACPWVRFGYFNPYLGDKAELPEISG